MMKRSWLRNWFSRRATTPIRKDAPRARLNVEALEDRTVPTTFTVINTSDAAVGSLRWAVGQANANSGADTIDFDSGVFATPQSITLTSGQLDLTDTATTTITGPGVALLSISGNNASRMFNVNAGASASISDMTLTGGRVNGTVNTAAAAGAAVYNAGTLDLTNLNVTGNSSNGGGGAGFGGAVHSQGDTTLTNCTISGNTGIGLNSGNGSGTLTVSNATISGNSLAGVKVGGGRARITDTTVTGNLQQGVTAYVTDLTMSNCTVSGNSYFGDGAGVQIGLGTSSLTNCTITGNTALGNGGGIALRGNTTITNCTITGNTAARGGGFDVFSGTAIFANTIVAGNTATNAPDVGGATNPQAFTSLGHNLIGKTNGSTGWVGTDLTGTIASPLNAQLAALANNGGATQTMAPLSGSPVINAGGSTLVPSEVQDVTVSGSAGTFTLTFNGQTTSAIVFNAAAGTVQTALNALSSIGGVSGSVTVTKSSNVYRVAFGGSLANQNLAQISAVGAGGATTAVLTLVNGNTDQRGLARFGNTDIGAFEHQFKVTTTADTGAGSLRQAIANANAAITADTIVFTSLFNSAQTITLTSGELALTDTATTTITGTGASLLSISGNNASRVFNINAGASAAISGLTVTGGNSAQGGGLFNSGTLSLASVTVSGNTAGGFFSGGGLFNNAGGSATLTSVTVSGNTGTGTMGGGGINNFGAMTLTNSTISGNSATNSGGGFANQYSATATLTNVTVSGNAASGGAGVDMDGQNAGGVGMTLALINCTISGNTANAGSGGGFYAIRGGAATMTNVTVSGNSASGNGGGFAVSFGGSTLTLANTIVAGNISTSGPDATGAVGTIFSQGHNLIGKTDTSTGWIGSDLTGTVASPLNAQLAAMANNGGTTQTIALLFNSPAIDAGDVTFAPTTDQRSLTRFGNTDIGAFEYQFKVTTTADSGNGSLRQAIANANSATTADTVVFTSLFNTTQTITLTTGTLTLSDAAGLTLIGPGAALTIGGNAITNNAPLALNTSNSISVSSAIGGAGDLTNAGTGALILSGTNTYSGATTISAGTLQIGAGGATGSLGSGAVIDDASLVFNKSANTFVGNTISGTGSLTVSGTGAVVLTNSNSYANTIVNSGGLQIGAAGTTGTLGVGAVTINSGFVSFNRLGTTTVSNAISGSGTLAQTGPAGSTVILTGANSYGGSQINSGATLQIGAGGTTGSLGTGAVADNGTLAFNRSDSITIANVISGSGSLTQAGSGTTILTAANAYGTTTISAGSLQVGNGGTTGSLGAGAVIDNATLTFNRSDSINITNVISGSGTLNLISTGGAISQSAAIAVGTLVADAATGITLTNAGNAIGHFTGTTVAGGIDVITTGALRVLGATAANNISFTTIDTLAIGEDLTVVGDITSASGSILLRGGDNVTVQAGVTLQAAGTITVYGDYGNADPGVGTTVIVASTPLTHPTDIAIFGNTDDDKFDVSGWTGTATIDGVDNAPNSNQVLGGNVVSFQIVDLITTILHRLAGFFGDITQKNVNRIDLTIPEFTDRSIDATALTQDLTIHDPGNGNVVLQLGSGNNAISKDAPAGGGSTGTTHEYVAGTGSTTFDIGPGSDVIINTSFSTSAANNVLKFTRAKAGVSFDVSKLNTTQVVDSSGNTLEIIDSQNRIIPTVVGSQFADTLSNTQSYAGVLSIDGGGGGDTITNTASNITTLRATSFASFSNTGSNVAIDVSGTAGTSFSSNSSDYSVNAAGASFNNFSALTANFSFVATNTNLTQASFSVGAAGATFSALNFDGDDVTFSASNITFDGDETTFNAHTLHFDGDEVTFNGVGTTFDGDDTTFAVRKISFDGDETTFSAQTLSFDGDEVTFTGAGATFDGDETTFAVRSISFDGDDVTFNGAAQFDGDDVTFDGDDVTFKAATRFDADEVTFSGIGAAFTGTAQFNGLTQIDPITGFAAQKLTVHAGGVQFGTTTLFDGDDVTFDGDDVTFNGAAAFGQLSFDGDEVTFNNAQSLQFDGDDVTFNGAAQFDGDDVTFDGDDVTFKSATRFDADEVTFSGIGAAFTGTAQFNGLTQIDPITGFAAQKLTVHAGGVQFGTTTLFDGDDVTFDGDDVTFNGAAAFGQLSFDGDEVTFSNAKSLQFDGDDVTFNGAAQFDGDDVTFDGDDVTFKAATHFDADEVTFSGIGAAFTGTAQFSGLTQTDPITGFAAQKLTVHAGGVQFGTTTLFDGDDVTFDGDDVTFNGAAGFGKLSFDGDEVTFSNAKSLQFDGDDVTFNGAAQFDGDDVTFDGDDVTFNGTAQFDGDDVTFATSHASFLGVTRFSGRAADFTGSVQFDGDETTFSDTTIFDGDEVIFNGIGATFRAQTTLIASNGATFKGTLFSGNTIEFHGASATFDGDETVFDGDEVTFDGDDTTFNGTALFIGRGPLPSTISADRAIVGAANPALAFQGTNLAVAIAHSHLAQVYFSASNSSFTAVGATLTDLQIAASATGSSFDLSGATFNSLTNQATGVNITAHDADFAVIENDASNVNNIDVSGSDRTNAVVNTGSSVANIHFQGNGGDDTFINTGNNVTAEFDGGAGDDSASIGGAGVTIALDGGAGADTFSFLGAVTGAITIGAADSASDAALDTVDFSSYTAGGITLNLGLASPQAIASSFALTIAQPIGNATGTSAADYIVGNSLANVLQGADLPDDRIGPVAGWNGRMQVVYLDFDTYTNVIRADDQGTDEHVYTPTERDEIQARMEAIYHGLDADPNDPTTWWFPVFITQDINVAQAEANATQNVASGGVYAPVYFNRPRLDANGNELAGGESDELDFRNQSFGGELVLQVNGLLPVGTPEPANWWVNASANIAIHEIAHMMGVRHGDAFGPIGFGIHNPPGAATYSPLYPGLSAAFETNDHIITSPASTGSTLTDEAGDLYFGEREAVRLAMAFYTPTTPDGNLLVDESGAVHADVGSAQALHLTGLYVPNTLHVGALNYGKTFSVAAVSVVGTMHANNEVDVYSFVGRAGDLMNMEVISDAVLRPGVANHPLNAIIEVLDSNGNRVGYFNSGDGATNDDEFESIDAQIVDLRLPADGTYYVRLTTKAADDGVPFSDNPGNYELFMYRFKAANIATAGDTLDGGAGNDTLEGVAGYSNTLIGGPGVDTITGSAFDTTYDSVVVNVNAGSTPSTLTEGSSFSGAVSFTNLGSTSWTATIDYGDGSLVETLHLSVPSFALSHQYRADDGSYNIAITVTNDDGVAGTASWHLDMTNVAPTPSIDSIGATRIEGSAITVTGSATDPAGANDTLTYTWAVLKNGAAYGTASGVNLNNWSFTPNDNGSYEVRLTVSDEDGGSTAAASQTISVANVAPASVLLSPTPIDANRNSTLTGTFTDPGALDTHMVVISWGDGTPNSTVSVAAGILTFSTTHHYANNPTNGAAAFVITATVTDKDNDSSAGSASLLVGTLIGKDNQDNTWYITGHNQVQLYGVTYEGVKKLIGGNQADTFIFLPNGVIDETIDGGAGVNTLDYSAYSTSVSVNLTAGTASKTAGVTHIRNLIGGTGNDTLIGDAQDNTITGNAGSDSLDGGSGNDTYRLGQGGDDVIHDAGGNDWLDFSAASFGIDVNLGLNNGQKRFIFNDHNDDSYEDHDWYDDDSHCHDHDNDNSHNTLTMFGAIENVIGSAFDDRITGSDAANIINALGGNNKIWTGQGDDTITAGTNGAAGSNNIHSGQGVDTITLYGNGKNQVHADGGGDLIFIYGNGANNVQGGNGNNTIAITGNGNNQVATGSGSDTVTITGNGANQITSGAGNDSISITGTGANNIDAGSGNDIVYGGAGNDTINGGSGDDISVGGDGNDVLVGGEGNDMLVGGNGFDTLQGSSGSDVLIAGTANVSTTALQISLAAWVADAANKDATNTDAAEFVLVESQDLNDMRVDTLTGNGGADLFILGAGDKVTDFVTKGSVTTTDAAGNQVQEGKDGDVVIWLN